MASGQVIPFVKPSGTGGWLGFIAITSGMCIALFLAIFLSGNPPQSNAAINIDPYQAHFGLGSGSNRRNCIVDGDTFWFAGRKIRIADINTPEISSPGCASEERLGQRATIRLHSLLNNGRFTLKRIDRDQDKYGRDLRIITRDGKSIGDILVHEGFAERWQGFCRNWYSR